jgi:hypothetical protein
MYDVRFASSKKARQMANGHTICLRTPGTEINSPRRWQYRGELITLWCMQCVLSCFQTCSRMSEKIHVRS